MLFNFSTTLFEILISANDNQVFPYSLLSSTERMRKETTNNKKCVFAFHMRSVSGKPLPSCCVIEKYWFTVKESGPLSVVSYQCNLMAVNAWRSSLHAILFSGLSELCIPLKLTVDIRCPSFNTPQWTQLAWLFFSYFYLPCSRENDFGSFWEKSVPLCVSTGKLFL